MGFTPTQSCDLTIHTTRRPKTVKINAMPVRWFALLLLCLTTAAHAAAPAALPPAANKPVSFTADIRPLLEQSCLQCHAKGKAKGGFSVETRESFLKGGDSGPAAVVGKSG